jgi:hypothetical protein
MLTSFFQNPQISHENPNLKSQEYKKLNQIELSWFDNLLK